MKKNLVLVAVFIFVTFYECYSQNNFFSYVDIPPCPTYDGRQYAPIDNNITNVTTIGWKVKNGK
ncbi:hypothetical protein FACS1894153_1040 [Bacteroidia bacterium]|nr:hypothetical protein FACS1894153_1040 [Bacteroidia bacterium]